jgi:CRP/FNR family transcriptional regulator
VNTTKKHNFLAGINPFSALPPAALKELAAAANFSTFDQRELIFVEQTDGHTGYVIVQGRVALLKTSLSGKELIVELLSARELFGVVVLLERQPYPLTARAQIPSSVLGFSRPLMQSLLKQHPSLHHGFTSLLSRRLHTSHNLARALAHDKVEVRIASVLSALGKRDETDEIIEIGRQELADVCGVTIETASRVMKSFEKAGFVDLSVLGKIKLLDKSAIRQTAESGSI